MKPQKPEPKTPEVTTKAPEDLHVTGLAVDPPAPIISEVDAKKGGSNAGLVLGIGFFVIAVAVVSAFGYIYYRSKQRADSYPPIDGMMDSIL
ncbi:hypothetical protein QR680_008416 [Steinernema hermaphroditum]|nr:hypothetical protein QR680_008416 [Steinernema hermaphroditum]